MTDIYETSATDSSSSSVLSRIDGMTVCFEYKCIVFLFCTKTEILSGKHNKPCTLCIGEFRSLFDILNAQCCYRMLWITFLNKSSFCVESGVTSFTTRVNLLFSMHEFTLKHWSMPKRGKIIDKCLYWVLLPKRMKNIYMKNCKPLTVVLKMSVIISWWLHLLITSWLIPNSLTHTITFNPPVINYRRS